MVSFLLVLSVPLILVVGGFVRINDLVIDYARESGRSGLQQVQSTVEGYVADLRTISRTLALDTRILELKHREELTGPATFRTVYRLQQDLVIHSISHGFLFDYFLLFDAADVVLGPHAFEDARFFYLNRMQFGDLDFTQWHATYIPRDASSSLAQTGLAFFPELTVHLARNDRDLIPVVAPVSIPPERPVYAVYLLESRVLRSLLETLLPQDGEPGAATGSAYVSAPDGTPLLVAGAPPDSISPDDRSFVRYTTTGSSGLQYTAIQPLGVIRQSVRSVAALAIATLAVAFVAGFIIAVFLAYRTAQPVDAMLGKLSDDRPTGPTGNPLALLEQRFTETIDHSRALERTLTVQRSLALAGFVERLLRGYGNLEGARKVGLDRYLPLDAASYRAMIVRIGEQGEAGVPMVPRELIEPLVEGRGYVHPISDEQYVVILAERNAGDQDAVDLTERCARALAGLGVSGPRIAIGTGKGSLPALSHSFEEAAVADAWDAEQHPRRPHERTAAIFFTDIPVEKQSTHQPDVESRTHALIRAGQVAPLTELLADSRRTLSAPGVLGVHGSKVLLFRLLGAVLRAQPYVGDVMTESDVDHLVRDASSPLADASDVFDRIADLALRCAESVAGQASSTATCLAERVCAYLQEHYPDSSLSLASVSEAFQVSEYYLSKVVSQHGPAPFHEYLEQLRIERAKQLLADHARAVGDIAGECGYYSATTFGRAFKRAVGVTPTSYRRTASLHPATVSASGFGRS